MDALLRLRPDVNLKCSHNRSAFWHAVRNGNVGLLRQLYSLGAEIDEPDVLGITPFASACAKGLIAVVECLYRFCPSLITTTVSLSSGEVWHPLFLSMGYGHRRVSEYLMSKCGPISLTYRDAEGRSALFMAINSGSFELAHSLIQRVLSSKCVDSRQMALQLLCRPNNSNISPLWLACLYGDVGCVEWIISTLRNDFGFSPAAITDYVNRPDIRNASPLFVAVQEGSAECARVLIENKADVDHEPRAGFAVTSPIVKACALGNLDVVKLLLHSGAKRYNDIHTLPVATVMEQRHVVRYLEKTQGYCSRLHYAEELPASLVLDLVRAGADIRYNSENDQSVTISPLQVAESRESGRPVPIQVKLILKASRPWSVENHTTFPETQRKLAVFVSMNFGINHFRGVPLEVWTAHVLPFLIDRGPPLTRAELNAILPGDGRPNRAPRFSEYQQ